MSPDSREFSKTASYGNSSSHELKAYLVQYVLGSVSDVFTE